jgi:crotonobetainyl-CoA:carnitine CoA-transferase CaiB-like acyl-CoA transferase
MGNRSWTVTPQGSYRVLDVERVFPNLARDEWVAVSVETDEQWLGLCNAIGAGQLAEDESLRTVEGRRVSHDRIDEAISAWTRPRTAFDVVEALTSAGVPCARWVQIDDLVRLPQVVNRQLYETVEHPALGSVPIITYPVRFQHGPKRWHRTRAPLLGEHNHEILRELGYETHQIENLETRAVIGTRAKTLTPW